MRAIPLLDLQLRIRQNYLNSLPPPTPVVDLKISSFANDDLVTFGGDNIIQMRYIFEDNFETVSPKAGWTYNSNANSTLNPLVGSRSLRATSSNNFAFLDLGGSHSELWAFYTFYTDVNFAYLIAIYSAATNTQIVAFGPWGAGTTRFLGTGFDDFPSVNTTSVQKYCWMRYVKGTGSNSIVTIWLSDTPVRPASPSFSRTNLSYTMNADSLFLVTTGSSSRRQIDYLRVSDKEIGDYPI
jgi:hypothetical protein